MTSTNVKASTGEITEDEVQEGAAVASDNVETSTVQMTAEEEQLLGDCIDNLFQITECGKEIGRGGQATILKSRYEGRSVVLKVFKDKSKVPAWDDPEVFNIIAPHVCSSLGYAKVHDGKESVASIMPRLSQDLRKLIDSRLKTRPLEQPPFSYEAAVDLIAQVAIGMNTLHKRNIMHRDIKAANILVIDTNEKFVSVAIADFDGCKGVVGSGFWRAPEVLEALTAKNGQKPQDFTFTRACDVYSFAITCFEILTGGLPFKDKLMSDYHGVLSGERPKLPANLPQDMALLINRCWHQDPQGRPDSNAILQILREMIKERTELKRVQTRFDLADLWSDEATSDQPSPEELLQSLKDELEVLEQQNEIQAARIGNEFIKIYEEYKTNFGHVNVWHLRRFWEKLEVALRMINKGNEFIKSLPDKGSNTVKVLKIWSSLVKPLVAVRGFGSIFQAIVRTYGGALLQKVRETFPALNLRLISEQLRDYLKSFRASHLACRVRLACTTMKRALRTCFKVGRPASSEVEAPVHNTLVTASRKTYRNDLKLNGM